MKEIPFAIKGLYNALIVQKAIPEKFYIQLIKASGVI
jgi:hypothetical protein